MYNLFALFVIALGGLNMYVHPEGLSPASAVQVVIGVVGGILFLVYNNASSVLSMFKRDPNRVVAPVPTVKVTKVTPVKPPIPTPEDGILPPNNFELYDNTSLIHIRNRLRQAGNKEGLDICAKLAAIMFSLDNPYDVPASAEDAANVAKTKVSV